MDHTEELVISFMSLCHKQNQSTQQAESVNSTSKSTGLKDLSH